MNATHAVPILSAETLRTHKPKASFAEGFDITRELRLITEGQHTVAEFIGTGHFAQQFFERQQYEIDAGRGLEPLLYGPIYDLTEDPSLPRLVPIHSMGPAGIVFERVEEGGEVKFASMQSGSRTVELVHYAAGIEYSDDLFAYNELWRLSSLERQFGSAYHALLNHVHLAPILSASYDSAHQTDGTALTSFAAAADLAEKYLRALEAAMSASVTDADDPRRGPYVLLVASADLFTVQRALNPVAQQGFDLQGLAGGRIRAVVAYDGWSGLRGNALTSYPGVTAGTAYLIDLSRQMQDFQSFVKHPLRRQQREGDGSRFVVEQVIYHARFGVYAAPTRAVQELTWPQVASGV